MINTIWTDLSPSAVRFLLLLPLLLWATVTDLRRSLIPNSCCLILLICGLVLPAWHQWDLSWSEVMGATLLTFIVSYGLYLLGQGAGDAKLLTALAALFGYAIIVVAVLSYLLAGCVALILLALKRITRQTRLPLAPAITAATLLYLSFTVFNR